jgi:hypothetical protein
VEIAPECKSGWNSTGPQQNPVQFPPDAVGKSSGRLFNVHSLLAKKSYRYVDV